MPGILDVLTKARNLIPSPDHWCTGAFKIENGSGVSYCARGAIYAALGVNDYDCYSDHDEPYCRELIKELPHPYSTASGKYGARTSVALYNNEHTYEDVAGMFDKAISRLKRGKVIQGMLKPKIKQPETV